MEKHNQNKVTFFTILHMFKSQCCVIQKPVKTDLKTQTTKSQLGVKKKNLQAISRYWEGKRKTLTFNTTNNEQQ